MEVAESFVMSVLKIQGNQQFWKYILKLAESAQMKSTVQWQGNGRLVMNSLSKLSYLLLLSCMKWTRKIRQRTAFLKQNSDLIFENPVYQNLNEINSERTLNSFDYPENRLQQIFHSYLLCRNSTLKSKGAVWMRSYYHRPGSYFIISLF